MPTYQYACTECEHDFEQVQSFTDDALTVCPVCSGRLRKVFNAVGVVFKGSGFYRNDSRDAKVPARAGSGEGSGTSDGGQESGTKEAGGKDSGTKESGGSGTKKSGESGGKEAAASGAKESGATKPSKPSGAKTGSSNAA